MSTEIRLMIDDLLLLESGLSGWEMDFIESLDKQYGDRGSLTEKQEEKLSQIWEAKS